MEQADADFIAAANPTAILELIRRLREAGGLRALCPECARKIDEVAGVDVAAKNKRIAALESELVACRRDASASDVLAALRDEVKEMQEAAYTYGDYSKEAVRVALDGVIDAIDAARAKEGGAK